MTEHPSAQPTGANVRGQKNTMLRILALAILILVVWEGLLGSALMSGPPFGHRDLGLHIAVGLLLVGLSTGSFVYTLRLPDTRRRVATGVTAGAAIAATLAGVVFIIGDESPVALSGMEYSTLFVVVAAILVLVWG